MEDLKIQLDFRHKIPLSDQVQTQLRGLIQSGALQSGDQLPTVRQLAAQLRINFNTVARAYRVLDEEGWISTQQGRGTYILDESERISPQYSEAETVNIDTKLQNDTSPLDPIDVILSAASTAGTQTVELIETVDNASANETGLSACTPVPLDASANESPSGSTTGDAKEVAINQLIEHLISEAAQQGITIEELHQGIIKKLTSTQADEEVLPTKKMPRRAIKQTLKPGHQNFYSVEKADSQKHIRRRKTVQHVRK